MKELEVTWGRVARAWWAYTWRYMVIGWCVGLLILAALWLAGMDLQSRTASIVGGSASVLLQALVQIWAFREMLRVDFREFRVTMTESFAEEWLRELRESAAFV